MVRLVTVDGLFVSSLQVRMPVSLLLLHVEPLQHFEYYSVPRENQVANENVRPDLSIRKTFLVLQ